MKRVYKSRTNKVIAGVLGGIGEYFNIDPVIIRVAYLLITLTTGFFPGVLAYGIAFLLIPKEPIHHHHSSEHHSA